MAVIVMTELAMHFVAGLPLQVEVTAIVLALGGAFWFTKWYPSKYTSDRAMSHDLQLCKYHSQAEAKQ